MRRARLSALAMLVTLSGLALSGCGILYGRPMEVEHDSGVTSTGVYWEDQLRGVGPPAAADSVVTIHYVARLEKNDLFIKVEITSIAEARSESDAAMLFGARLVVRPAYGLSGGPTGMRRIDPRSAKSASTTSPRTEVIR